MQVQPGIREHADVGGCDTCSEKRSATSAGRSASAVQSTPAMFSASTAACADGASIVRIGSQKGFPSCSRARTMLRARAQGGGPRLYPRRRITQRDPLAASQNVQHQLCQDVQTGSAAHTGGMLAAGKSLQWTTAVTIDGGGRWRGPGSRRDRRRPLATQYF